MTCESTIELTGLNIETHIGTYGPGESVPNAHLLDLRLWIDSSWVLIAEDGMPFVFDYDPLIREIDRLALDGHYETQERLVTRIAEACAARTLSSMRSTSCCAKPLFARGPGRWACVCC